VRVGYTQPPLGMLHACANNPHVGRHAGSLSKRPALHGRMSCQLAQQARQGGDRAGAAKQAGRRRSCLLGSAACSRSNGRRALARRHALFPGRRRKRSVPGRREPGRVPRRLIKGRLRRARGVSTQRCSPAPHGEDRAGRGARAHAPARACRRQRLLQARSGPARPAGLSEAASSQVCRGQARTTPHVHTRQAAPCRQQSARCGAAAAAGPRVAHLERALKVGAHELVKPGRDNRVAASVGRPGGRAGVGAGRVRRRVQVRQPPHARPAVRDLLLRRCRARPVRLKPS